MRSARSAGGRGFTSRAGSTASSARSAWSWSRSSSTNSRRAGAAERVRRLRDRRARRRAGDQPAGLALPALAPLSAEAAAAPRRLQLPDECSNRCRSTRGRRRSADRARSAGRAVRRGRGGRPLGPRLAARHSSCPPSRPCRRRTRARMTALLALLLAGPAGGPASCGAGARCAHGRRPFADERRARAPRRLRTDGAQPLQCGAGRRNRRARSAEARARRLRDDLAQANRLSILGQVAAGVAHEINQPVAAIRAYAETAAGCLDAGKAAQARGNLGAIVGVTERIGAITQALRGFARRGAGDIGPSRSSEAIDGALTLLAGPHPRCRRRRSSATARPPGATRDGRAASGWSRSSSTCCRTRSTRSRGSRPDDRRSGSPADATASRITVADNGPGVSPGSRATSLFMPFTTTKDNGPRPRPRHLRRHRARVRRRAAARADGSAGARPSRSSCRRAA